MQSELPPPPLVSIVVATYNADLTVERCLASIIGQSSSDWELILIDGGSTDNTMSIIKDYAAYTAFSVSEKDGGIYDAWNKGLAQARGQYICFLGADDAFADECAIAAIHHEIGSQQFDLVSSRGKLVDSQGTYLKEHGGEWNFAKIGRRMPMCHPGLWHARELFAQYGVFDASYRIAGDLDFLLRLPASLRTKHLDRITVVIEAGGISRSQTWRRLREQRRALRRCTRYGPARAWVAWLDKAWRYPIARLFGLSF